MNNTINYSTELDPNELDVSRTAPPLKTLVFNVGSLNLGLPIESVHKVLNSAQIHGSGLNWVGLVHMSDREVTVLDLQRWLFHTSKSSENFKADYLIVVQNKNKELYGIPVETVPALIDVPVSSIRFLPETFRHADTLGIASHVAILTQSETPMTLFLLDIDATTTLPLDNVVDDADLRHQ